MNDRKKLMYLVLFSSPLYKGNGKSAYGLLVEAYTHKQAEYEAGLIIRETLVMNKWFSHEGEDWLKKNWTGRRYPTNDDFEIGNHYYEEESVKYDSYTYFPQRFRDECTLDLKIGAVDFDLWGYETSWFSDEGFLLEPTLAHTYAENVVWVSMNEIDKPCF